MYNRLYEILTAKWLINADVIKSYLPVFMSFLNGNAINMSDFKDDKQKAYAIAPANPVSQYDIADKNIPENSIAIIPITGVITSWKSMKIEEMVKDAEANPNIIGILFMVNTPGGMVFYTDILANTIKTSKLPTVSYIMQMAASAGMWLVSATGARIVSSQLDYMGSIGVMTSYTDLSKMLEDKLGIKITDFYATKSTRKNELTRAIMNADLSVDDKNKMVAAELDPVNEIFHKAIHDNMGIDSNSEVFSGALYYAPQAIKLGLANEIGSFESALNHVYQLGLKNKIKSYYQ